MNATRIWKPPARLAVAFLALGIIFFHAGAALGFWFPEERLTNSSAASYTSPNNAHCAAFDSAGNIHVVWQDYRAGNIGIYHKFFDGSTWSPDSLVTIPSAIADDPALAADGLGNLHLVWTDYRDGSAEIYYKLYDGAGWGGPQRLTDAAGSSVNPAIAAEPNGHLHVVWQDFRDGNWEIYYKAWQDTAWSEDLRLTNNASNSTYPAVAVDAWGWVHVVWQDYRAGNNEIYYKRFNGSTWTSDTRLTRDSNASEAPCLAVDSNGYVHVVWQDNRDGNYEIYHKINDRTSWGADYRVTYESHASKGPSVAADDSANVYAVWFDDRDGNTEIYFNRFDGGTWGLDYRLSQASQKSENPSVAADEWGNLQVVWQDRRDANWEIYGRWFQTEALPAPLVTSIEPSEGVYGQIVSITDLAGDNFVVDAQVWLHRDGVPNIIATDVVVESAQKITCVFDLAGAPIGAWDVVVQNLDGQTGVLAAGFTVIPLPPPQIISIEPASAVFGTAVNITNLAGDYFVSPAEVWFQKSGQPDLVATRIVVQSPTKITCAVDLAGGSVGPWDVVVENPDGKRDTLVNGFEILHLPPLQVTSIEPAGGYPGQLIDITNLAGNNFVSPAQVWFQKTGQPDLVATQIVVQSPTKITCRINLAGTATGAWDVVVEIPDGQRDTLVAGFDVMPWPIPEVTSIEPSQGYPGLVIEVTDLAGNNFIHPVEVWLQMAGESDIVATDVVVESPQKITCVLDLGTAATGDWDVVIENPDGQRDSLVEGFSVVPWPKPEAVSIEPSEGFTNDVVNITDLAGDDFIHPVQVVLLRAGQPNIYATNVVVHSPQKITCVFNLTGAAAGDRDVEVRNPDGQRDTLVAGFTVLPIPTPVIASIEPREGVSGEGVYISDLAGSGFHGSAVARLQMAGEADISATDIVVESPEKITCSFSLVGAVPGYWDVVVENPTDLSDTLSAGFRVLPGIWSVDTRLTYDNALSSTSKSNARCVAVDASGRVHVVWYDQRDGQGEIYHKRYDGTAWEPDERLTYDSGSSQYPAIAAGGSGDVHVVWSDNRDGNYEIYYKHYDGTAWGPDERLTDAPLGSAFPSVAVDGDDNPHVVWQDYRNNDYNIYYRGYDGVSWGPEQPLTDSFWDKTPPAVAVDASGNIHVVWQEYIQDHMVLLYRKYNGLAWGATDTLVNQTTVGIASLAAGPDDHIHLTWHDDRYANLEVFYKQYDGLSWGEDQRISEASLNSQNTSAAVDDSGKVYVVWSDERNGSGEIYYRMFEGGGWAPEIRLTYAPGESRFPSAATDHSGRLHIVWRDLRDGNYEIYYKLRDPGVTAQVADGPVAGPSCGWVRIAPNPVQEGAQIGFALDRPGLTDLCIYDVMGRLIWKSSLGFKEAGRHQVAWNVADLAGSRVSAGIYLVKVTAGRRTSAAKIIVLK